MEWSAEAVRALRHALRFSQEDLAQHLGTSAKTIRSWERGEHRPRPVHQQALDTALARLSQDQRHSYGEYRSLDTATTIAAEPLGNSAQAAAALHLPLSNADDGVQHGHLESIELVRQLEVSNVSSGALELLDDAVADFGRQYLTTPQTIMLPRVLRLRRYACSLLEGRQSLIQQQRLYQSVGWLSALLRHIAFDLGHQAPAEAHCVAALRFAHEAEARDLTAWTLGTRTMVALFFGQAEKAARYAQSACEASVPATPIAARAAAQEARAWARLGDTKRAERALGLAQELFSRLPHVPEPGIFSFQAPYLPFYAGTAYIWLDQPARAERNARDALAQCDLEPEQWPVARVSARFDLAIALARQGEVDEACAVAAEALHLVSARPTEPARQRAVELISSLSPHRELSAVREMKERMGLVPWTDVSQSVHQLEGD